MKVKAGSGSPTATYSLLSLQSQLCSLKAKYFLVESEARSEKGSDWRLWSSLEPESYAGKVLSDVRHRVAMYEKYKVSPQCRSVFGYLAPRDSSKGPICLCGHPDFTHVEGGLCEAGIGICYCAK